jgi:hypothetical protein
LLPVLLASNDEFSIKKRLSACLVTGRWTVLPYSSVPLTSTMMKILMANVKSQRLGLNPPPIHLSPFLEPLSRRLLSLLPYRKPLSLKPQLDPLLE